MQQFSRWGEVMHIGGCGNDRVDQTLVLVNADVDFHAVVPLVAIHFLMPPAHSGFALVKVELGAAIKVASTIVP